MSDLFGQAQPAAPLAEAMRPQALDDVVGQNHLLGPGKPLRMAFESGKVAAFARAQMHQPNEIFTCTTAHDGGGFQQVTHHNKELLDELDIPKPESVKVKIEGGHMQMWILKPPGFDATSISA